MKLFNLIYHNKKCLPCQLLLKYFVNLFLKIDLKQILLHPITFLISKANL